MAAMTNKNTPVEVFESMPIHSALTKMAIPTIASQLVVLIYNLADTWFIGKTNNPYMVAASSLVLTVFLLTSALSNLFGTGGGTLVVRLLGAKQEDEAKKAASLSLVMAAGATLFFSLCCLIFMNPLLKALGASENTIGYARQYLFFVIVLGGVPTVLSNTMSNMVRNVGYSKEAGFGLSMGGLLNVALDPLFMFVLLPDGYQVMGAAIATMLSNMVVLCYFIVIYKKLSSKSVLELPKRIEKISRPSFKALFAVGLPAASGVMLYDLSNMVINRLSSGHGDIELAAIGIVLKAERLPINIGLGICFGMMPLIAYNFAAKNHKRMMAFFSTARTYGLIVAAISLVLYRTFAPFIVRAFISDAETVMLGTEFIKVRCLAPAFMFLSFHMVHFMESVGKGKVAFWLCVIRQLCLNIPILIIMDHFFGMKGIVFTQVFADFFNVVATYIIYFRVKASLLQ
ncbi:MAG: cation transporter [Oscillospiraceae bacterium]|nr:cation transporter [Oscillospiraceae bacterium]MBQ4539145.1 cation transporter [Oscillospiraceae bacterium]